MAESYPVPVAGQRLTAGLLRDMLPRVARKTADTARAATTALVADPHLQFEVEAQAVYTLDGWIKYEGPSAADITIDWTAPAGSLGEWVGTGVGHSPTITASTTAVLQMDTQSSRGYLIRTEANDLSQFRSFGTITGASPFCVLIMGTLRVGAVGGIYSLDWAQGASDASPVTVYTDSWLRLQRIA
ncbi:hypothetical protein [Streptomyces uncialis]|uniref:hypothetical protein n=1 Tax=Streptomyces uncialis TaxID=1048205 RepID=UPI00378C418F